MKISIKNLFALALTAIVLTSSANVYAADGEKNVTVLNQIKHINKINVSGNVALIIVQSDTESVKVYDDYYAKNALVQEKDGVLNISSFEKETLTVVAYINNLSEIEASENATVVTQGKLNTLSLSVILKDSASATLNTNTVALYSNVKNNASLTLSGLTDDYSSVMGNLAKVTMEKFSAENSNIITKNETMVLANSAATADLNTL